MAIPRVLLVTGAPPGNVGVGALYLRELCKVYPHDRLCCFHTKPSPENGTNADLDWLPMEFAQAPRETADGLRSLHRGLFRLGRPLVEAWVGATRIPYLVERATKFGRSHSVEVVWATLNTPTTLRLARRVADSLGASLVTTVFDPPQYKLARSGLDVQTIRRLKKRFDDTIRTSIRCAVASEGMKSRYEEKYGTDCVPMIYCPRRAPGMFSERPRALDRRFVIAYAGRSIYAQDAWQALTRALADRHWKIGGREVVIKVMATRLPGRTTAPMNIEFLGWRNSLETLQLLSQADIAYLPYWFGDEYKQVVQVTFPNKCAAYISARLPVLYHGPRESSVSSLLKRFPLGIGCHSMDRNDIIAALEHLITDSDFLSRARTACDEAYEQELGPHVFRQRFAEFIGVSESELLPLEPSYNGGSYADGDTSCHGRSSSIRPQSVHGRISN